MCSIFLQSQYVYVPLILAHFTAPLLCELLLLDCDELRASLAIGLECAGDLSLDRRSSSGTSNTGLGIFFGSSPISVPSGVDCSTCAAPANEWSCSELFMCVYMYIYVAEEQLHTESCNSIDTYQYAFSTQVASIGIATVTATARDRPLLAG